MKWLLANVVGTAAGMLLFGVIADSGWAEEPKLLNIVAHLIGLTVAGGLLAALQRRAIGATRTPFLAWMAVLGLVQFLAVGVTYEIVGPPWDFVVELIALGAATGFLVRWEARAAQRPYPRWLVAKGALAGAAGIAGLVPVFAVADRINDAMGGGFAPFMVILGLIGMVSGLALGTLIRPAARAAA